MAVVNINWFLGKKFQQKLSHFKRTLSSDISYATHLLLLAVGTWNVNAIACWFIANEYSAVIDGLRKKFFFPFFLCSLDNHFLVCVRYVSVQNRWAIESSWCDKKNEAKQTLKSLISIQVLLDLEYSCDFWSKSILRMNFDNKNERILIHYKSTVIGYFITTWINTKHSRYRSMRLFSCLKAISLDFDLVLWLKINIKMNLSQSRMNTW